METDLTQPKREWKIDLTSKTTTQPKSGTTIILYPRGHPATIVIIEKVLLTTMLLSREVEWLSMLRSRTIET